MEVSQLSLDGNAAAGMLRNAFAHELTPLAEPAPRAVRPISLAVSIGTCTRSRVGDPRCRTCGAELMVMVHGDSPVSTWNAGPEVDRSYRGRLGAQLRGVRLTED